MMCDGGDCAEVSNRFDWWDSVNSVINVIVVTVIAIFFITFFNFCMIWTGLAESNAVLFDLMEGIFVTECVTGAFESRICKRTVKFIISPARELLKFFVLCDKLVSKE
jgi:uncharacterized membrane protein YqhA